MRTGHSSCGRSEAIQTGIRCAGFLHYARMTVLNMGFLPVTGFQRGRIKNVVS
jgi:hypothetical protein